MTGGNPDNSRAKAGMPGKRLITTHQFLSAFSRGEIGYRDAMRGIGVDDYWKFLDVLRDNGFRRPGGEPETDPRVE